MARRYSLSEPLVLTVVGIGISFIPHFLDIHLTPDIVLIGLLTMRGVIEHDRAITLGKGKQDERARRAAYQARWNNPTPGL